MLNLLNNNYGNFLVIGDFELFDEDELYLHGNGNVKVTQITGNVEHYKSRDFKTLIGCNVETIFEKVKEQLNMNHFDHIIANPPFGKGLQNKILKLCRQHCDNVVFLGSISHFKIDNYYKNIQRSTLSVIDGKKNDQGGTTCWIGTFTDNPRDQIHDEKDRFLCGSTLAQGEDVFYKYFNMNIDVANNKQYYKRTKISKIGISKIIDAKNKHYYLDNRKDLFSVNARMDLDPVLKNGYSVDYNLNNMPIDKTGAQSCDKPIIIMPSVEFNDSFKKFYYQNPLANKLQVGCHNLTNNGTHFDWVFPNIDWTKIDNPETITIEEIMEILENEVQ